MCGRLVCTLCCNELRSTCAYPKRKGDDIYEYVEPTFVKSSYDYTPLYNLCPSLTVPVLTAKNHLQFENHMEITDYVILPMRWGILPQWSSNVQLFNTHNTRIEQALQSQLARPELIKNRRCVVLCEGYFEWQKTKGGSQPYYLYPEKVEDTIDDSSYGWKSGKPLLKLAGLFSEKVDSQNVTRYSCSVITRPATEKLSWMHNRMPIALESFSDVESWINFEKLNCKQGLAFLNTYDEEKSKSSKNYDLKYHPVDKKYVNNVSNNDEMCIKRISVKRQLTLDNWYSKRGPAASK